MSSNNLYQPQMMTQSLVGGQQPVGQQMASHRFGNQQNQQSQIQNALSSYPYYQQSAHTSANANAYDPMMLFPQQMYQQLMQPTSQYLQYFNQVNQRVSSNSQTLPQQGQMYNQTYNPSVNANINPTNQYQNMDSSFDKKLYEPSKNQYLYNQGMQQSLPVFPAPTRNGPSPFDQHRLKTPVFNQRVKSPSIEEEILPAARSEMPLNNSNTDLNSMGLNDTLDIAETNPLEEDSVPELPDLDERPRRRLRTKTKKQLDEELVSLNESFFNAPKEPRRKRGRPRLLLYDSNTNEYMDSTHPNYKQLKKELESSGKLTDEFLSTYLIKKASAGSATSREYNEADIRDLMRKKDKRGRPRKFPIEETGMTVKGVRVDGIKKQKGKPRATGNSKRPRGRPRKVPDHF